MHIDLGTRLGKPWWKDYFTRETDHKHSSLGDDWGKGRCGESKSNV